MTNTCVCGCGRTLTDGYAHTECTGQARGQLKEISELVEPARAVMYRQTSTGDTIHSTPGPRDLLDYGAGARLDAVQNALTGWARQICEERGVRVDIGGDAIEVAAWFIAENLEWLRRAPWVDEVLREIGDCWHTMRSVVATPAGRVYLGVCGAETQAAGPCDCDCHHGAHYACSHPGGCGSTDGAHRTTCRGDVFGKPGKAAAYCNRCGAVYDQHERRVQVATLVDGRGFRASVIAHAYGIPVDTIRGWAWVRRDNHGVPVREPKLRAVDRDERGRPLYLVADVLALHEQARQRREQRTAQAAGMGA